MNTAVDQIQHLVELGMLPRDQAGRLLDEIEAVDFGMRKPGSLPHVRAEYLSGRIPMDAYRAAVRLSQIGWGIAVMLGLLGAALFVCLRDPGSVPSRDIVLPSLFAFAMGMATTGVLSLWGRGSLREDEERRRALD